MKPKGKQLIINNEQLEARVALLNNGRLEEYQIERKDECNLVGSIFLGRIVNHEPSLQAAFVDIGAEKNAFLHYWDMLPASYDLADKVQKKGDQFLKNKKGSSFSQKIRNLLTKNNKKNSIKEREKNRRRKKITIEDVPKIFPANSEILVQVTKGPIGTKGPRVTSNLTIPGRYLVLLPYANHIGLSKKIDDKKERIRIRKVLYELDIPDDMGVICRTVGEGRKGIYFKRDADMLLDLWHQVEEGMEKKKIPCQVFHEPDLIQRTVRDFLTEDIGEIVVDDYNAYNYLYERIKRFVGVNIAKKVRVYKKPYPIFEHYKVEEQINSIYKREVPLPSGGYICIDETEALIAIDVNTGRHRSGKNQPETILKTNLEACEEAARQLRLRNVGGLVIIDFIDMRPAAHRDDVLKYMRKLVKDDRAKMKILPISRLGLMEMTRQREHESLQDTVFDPCPYCNGNGRVKSAVSMSVEIQRALGEVLKRHRREKDISIRVIMHPSVLARLKNQDASLLIEMEKKYGRNLSFRADSVIHLEEFKLVDPETNVEYSH